MDEGADYAQCDEADLVDMFGRMDRRRIPVAYDRLKELLIERGYIVREGAIGPSSAVPSPVKLQALIGSPQPLEFRVTFGKSQGCFSGLEPARNDFHLVGLGTIWVDGVHTRLSGRRAGLLGYVFPVTAQMLWKDIVDVELESNVVHFEYGAQNSHSRAINLWFSDSSAAEGLAKVLPKKRTSKFRPQLQRLVEFESQLISQSPLVPMTVGLVAISTLVFLASLLTGAEWLLPRGAAGVVWGSNFGPFTTNGEWWRLLTSLFIHFGIIHLVFNMWALAVFGPLAERLYGSTNFLAIYIFAGLTASLASISWRPEINSAGSSGAILGVLGALLAAQLRIGKTFPGGIVRPLRNLTITFVIWTLYSGLAYTGIDNVAHLGGLASGFALGLILARPVTGKKSYTRSDFKRFLQMLPAALLMVGGGFWLAKNLSQAGEEEYWQTVHWLSDGERTANRSYSSALILAKSENNSQLLAAAVEQDVLPFWRSASKRLSGIKLKADSRNAETLNLLRGLSDKRVHGYELLADGLRKNNFQQIAAAQQTLKQADQTAR